MRVDEKHKNIMIETAEIYPQLITNKFDGANGRQEQGKIWTDLTNKLNCLGFGQRTTEEWKGTLSDWKSKTKLKASKMQQLANKTGGGTPAIIGLTTLEERLLNIMGIKRTREERLNEDANPLEESYLVGPTVIEEFFENPYEPVIVNVNSNNKEGGQERQGTVPAPKKSKPNESPVKAMYEALMGAMNNVNKHLERIAAALVDVANQFKK